jgi:hypothetical protein
MRVGVAGNFVFSLPLEIRPNNPHILEMPKMPDRFHLETRLEEGLNAKELVDVYYIVDTTPRSGRYPKPIGRFYDSRYAEVSLEALNSKYKPLGSFKLKAGTGTPKRRRSR